MENSEGHKTIIENIDTNFLLSEIKKNISFVLKVALLFTITNIVFSIVVVLFFPKTHLETQSQDITSTILLFILILSTPYILFKVKMFRTYMVKVLENISRFKFTLGGSGDYFMINGTIFFPQFVIVLLIILTTYVPEILQFIFN